MLTQGASISKSSHGGNYRAILLEINLHEWEVFLKICQGLTRPFFFGFCFYHDACHMVNSSGEERRLIDLTC